MNQILLLCTFVFLSLNPILGQDQLCKLRVKILNGQDLPRSSGFFSPTDPFVIVDFGRRSCTSSVKKRTRTPEWGQDCGVDRAIESGSQINVRVFDQDRFRNEPLGQGSFTLPKECPTSQCNNEIVSINCTYGQYVA